MFVVLLGLIPLTIYLGSKLPGRSYYLMSAVIAIEILIPFFMSFEGRKPQPRELVTIAVMAAMVTIARVAVGPETVVQEAELELRRRGVQSAFIAWR